MRPAPQPGAERSEENEPTNDTPERGYRKEVEVDEASNPREELFNDGWVPAPKDKDRSAATTLFSAVVDRYGTFSGLLVPIPGILAKTEKKAKT